MSEHLSNRKGGTCIIPEEYTKSENSLKMALIIAMKKFSNNYLRNTDIKLVLNKTIILYGCLLNPDGGILYLVKNNKKIPFLISEDKKQGTNDKNYFNNIIPELNKKKTKLIKIFDEEKIEYNDIDTTIILFEKFKSLKNYQELKLKHCKIFKQSIGNAIERFAKNLNAMTPLFEEYDIYPYVLFAAGCDFHDTETIHKRLSSGNFHKPNYLYNLNGDYDIDIGLYKNKFYAGNIFIKTHKYTENIYCDETSWSVQERVNILYNTMIKVYEYYTDLKII